MQTNLSSAVKPGTHVWASKPSQRLNWSERRLGAIVPDIDLEHLTDAQFERLGDALLLHSVICLKNQELSIPKQVEFSERFGDLELSLHREYTDTDYPALVIMSNLAKNGKRIGFVNENGWHTDFNTMERPSLMTMLYAIEVPEQGGDTLFADMYAAYDALPEVKKAELSGKSALHRYKTRYDTSSKEAARERCPDVVHPIVRTHPQTGRRALYLGDKGSAFAMGMPEVEGERYIAELIDLATQEQFVYRHKWSAGDIVIWDNRAVMHSATSYDTEKHRRLLHRTSSIGERPYFNVN